MTQEKSCKKNVVKVSGPGNGKIVLKLLKEILALYVALITIYII